MWTSSGTRVSLQKPSTQCGLAIKPYHGRRMRVFRAGMFTRPLKRERSSRPRMSWAPSPIRPPHSRPTSLSAAFCTGAPARNEPADEHARAGYPSGVARLSRHERAKVDDPDHPRSGASGERHPSHERLHKSSISPPTAHHRLDQRPSRRRAARHRFLALTYTEQVVCFLPCGRNAGLHALLPTGLQWRRGCHHGRRAAEG